MKKPIYVTSPTLTNLDCYVESLKNIWETGVLTHNGPYVQSLEKELCSTLGLENFVSVVNGTFALQMAIKALEIKGEIITTPFSWVATVSAIKWEGCTPIFCDIDPETFNIDPSKLESLITDRTVAIMPVHVFGNPCDVESIKKIADKHGLKVIYDAAHAVGTTLNGASVLLHGDVSAVSLHATKIFNTGEGGGCITKDNLLHEKLKRIRFFGHDDNKDVVEDGLNAKMTEVHAALGLANLQSFASVLKDRMEKYSYYKEQLSLVSNKLSFQKLSDVGCNYSYFPVVFESEDVLLQVSKALEESNIFARRYFYPSLNLYEKIVHPQGCPKSEDLSKRILCLPLYYMISEDIQDDVVTIIKDTLL